jgi:hypothetical protein
MIIPLRKVRRMTYSIPLLVTSRVRMARTASGPIDRSFEPPRKRKTKQHMKAE